MSLGHTFKLQEYRRNDPGHGLGTWQSEPKEVYTAVLTALEAGYRHIDTAFVYRNEKAVGQAIKDSGIPREQLFVTTKLWNTYHRPEDVETALTRSLDNLQMDYLDLYLMHWPNAFQPSPRYFPRDKDHRIVHDATDYCDTYAAMEKLVGPRVRAIGVSNFTVAKLDRLLQRATIVPAVLQVELHPYFPQMELVSFCAKHGIHVTAYSPLGSTSSSVMEDHKLLAIAAKHQSTPAQILLAWGIQRGTSVIPKSVTPSRIVHNFQQAVLDDADMATLNTLTDTPKRVLDPSSIWGVDIFQEQPALQPKL